MSSQKPNTNTRTTKPSYAMNPVKQEKPNVQTQNRFQVLGSIPSNQSKPTFAQIASSSQNSQYVAKAHVMKVQILEPFYFSNSRKPDISKKFPHRKYFLQNNFKKT